MQKWVELNLKIAIIRPIFQPFFIQNWVENNFLVQKVDLKLIKTRKILLKIDKIP